METRADIGTLGLLQLADSCFPAGGFAFSNGLEGLAKGGWLRGLEDFRQYLESYLGQVASAELPFLNSAFSGSEAAFADVAWEWDAFLTLPAPRQASLSLGRAWLRAMEGAYGGAEVDALGPWFRERGLPAHFLMAFAAALKAVGFRVGEAQTLLLHMALRDQLGAAVRLGLVGSLQAQGLHRRFLAMAEALRARHGSLPHTRSMKTCLLYTSPSPRDS